MASWWFCEDLMVLEGARLSGSRACVVVSVRFCTGRGDALVARADG